MTKQKRTTYSPEFKREAVRLLEQCDKETSQLARELGVARNKLYLWKDEIDRHGDSAFPGIGNRNGRAKTNDTSALKAEIKKLREENEILKKAAIFFAKESG
jgi:transposase